MAGVGFTDGDKGDITISSSGTVLTIDNDAVTYAKIQNVSATDRLLGRSSAGAGDVEEITCTSFGRSLISSADAAAARTTLSVQPTASPAFTGAAAFANTGNVVPLTVNNSGTSNSFVVNDDGSGDTTPFVIDADGNAGIGYSTPSDYGKLVVSGGTAANAPVVTIESTAFNASQGCSLDFARAGFTQKVQARLATQDNGASASNFIIYTKADGTAGALSARLTISSTGTATFAGQIVGQAGAAISGGAVTVTSPLRLTGTVAGNNRMLEWQTSGTTRWQVSAHFNAESGSNAGSDLYVSRWSDSGVFLGTPLQIRRDTGMVTCESGLTVQNSPVTVIGGSVSACSVAPSGDPNTGLYFPAADVAAWVTNGTERVRIGSGGRVQFFAADEKFGVQLNKGATGNGPFIGSDGADILTISTAGGAERVRVDASGDVVIGTTDSNPAGNNVAGCRITSGGLLNISRNQDISAFFNRMGNDGAIIWFLQAGTVEGDISVAGNTVSYNAFCGSHWGQLSDQSRPAILRGTVMETIDEMCDWPEDGGSSDRLVRVKVSDTPASRRVYGVFLGWDEKYASTGDMYVAGLGAYMVRVSGVVQSGDLLESAGDGTARTQADDLVRSTTIGKVSSTHRIAEYDDGSYLVPCVLMCG
jgi:hypothetical protein